MVLVLSAMVERVFARSVSASSAEILYRVNVGGEVLPSIDGGLDWGSDTAADPSRFSNGAGNPSRYSTEVAGGAVPPGTPSAVFRSGRWDGPGGENLRWQFPVAVGTYEVRLYFVDGHSTLPGQRAFDVAIEGRTALDEYDIVAEVGTGIGTMKSIRATVNDGRLDIEFLHAGANNPIVNAIEVLAADSAANELGASLAAVDFDSGLIGTTESINVTLHNLGTGDDPGIEINEVIVEGHAAFDAQLNGPSALAPGSSTLVQATFAPTETNTRTGTLVVGHSGQNSPLRIELVGNGETDTPVSFAQSTLDLSNAELSQPTALDFGPDGRLYVAERFGLIKAFDIARDGENAYRVKSAAVITAINDLPNHNDDGSTAGAPIERQVTGLVLSGTASKPVIYVSSSDPRAFFSPQLDRSTLGDTNSGVVSKLVRIGPDAWEHTALVRGLPRANEHHSVNGLQLDQTTNTLYLAIGGLSGSGAPNDKFSYTPEYAYSAAIVSIDLDRIEAMPSTSGEEPVPHKYNLPTLDPSLSAAPAGSPFGGVMGRNMAVWTLDSPVQVYASGLRNAYDLTLTEGGLMYATDNGAGAGWGDVPVGEGTPDCTNEPNNGGSADIDQLHRIERGGYYGHPNPTRGNPEGAGFYLTRSETDFSRVGSTQGTVPAPNPIECDYLEPVEEDGALTFFNASTNGIDEYTASNFAGAMRGDLLVASFDGVIRRIQLDGPDLVTDNEPIFSDGLTVPLDVHAPGDDGVFPGTVWVAVFGDNEIRVYEPGDYSDGSAQTADPDLVAGDPCSVARPSGQITGSPAARVSITAGGSLEASTYFNTAFQVENTGDVAIESVCIDTRSALFPDIVFDPLGTAGDAGRKGVTLSAASDSVGLVSAADSDVFRLPQNGVDGDDGYRVLVLEFTDFDPGEQIAFAADTDPNSIKGSPSPGPAGTGSVSGLEMVGTRFTLRFANGDALTVIPFGDGSDGGAQGSVTRYASLSPVLGAVGLELNADALAAHHSAAAVTGVEQQLLIDGPPNAEVRLLQVEGGLYTDGAVDGGYRITDFEANKALQQRQQAITLDSDGHAIVEVTLLSSDPGGGRNYFVATVLDGSGHPAASSNVVVLRLDGDSAHRVE